MTATPERPDPPPQERVLNDPDFEREIKRVMALAIHKHFRALGNPLGGGRRVAPHVGVSSDDLLAVAFALFVRATTSIRHPRSFAYKVAKDVALKYLDKETRRGSIVGLLPGDAPIGPSEDEGGGSVTRLELVESDDDTETEATDAILRVQLVELTSRILSEREHRILWRWADTRDANVIAVEEGVGATRVRQIVTTAQAKLLEDPAGRRFLLETKT